MAFSSRREENEKKTRQSSRSNIPRGRRPSTKQGHQFLHSELFLHYFLKGSSKDVTEII
jgi:hypothetical protein